MTSHCLAEASNLLRQPGDKHARNFLVALSAFSESFRESHILDNDHCYRLGIADTCIIRKSNGVSCTITMDAGLYRAIRDLGRHVIPFNHYRAVI